MDGVEWIGAIIAAVAGAGGVMYVTRNEFPSGDEDDGSDGRKD